MILYDGNFILQEGAINIVGLVMRREVDRGHRLNKVTGTPSGAQPPNDVLPGQKRQTMDKINVESIASLSQLGTEAVRAVVIHLNLHIGPLAQFTLPPSENVAAGYILRCVHIDRGRRRIKRKILSLPEFPRVRISLNRECVIFVI